ncbi:contractile injection system tape measure protein [Streptomyces sp. NPDC003233]
MRGVSPVSASAAGFVVLWPLVPRPAAQFWPDKFREQGATSPESKEKAQLVVLLDYAVWGNDKVGNWRLGFRKVLCGLPEDEEVVIDQPTDEQKAKVNAWLDPIISQLGHRGSREDFQALFLQRQGELVTDADGPPVSASLLIRATACSFATCRGPLEQIQYPWLKVPIAIN